MSMTASLTKRRSGMTSIRTANKLTVDQLIVLLYTGLIDWRNECR